MFWKDSSYFFDVIESRNNFSAVNEISHFTTFYLTLLFLGFLVESILTVVWIHFSHLDFFLARVTLNYSSRKVKSTCVCFWLFPRFWHCPIVQCVLPFLSVPSAGRNPSIRRYFWTILVCSEDWGIDWLVYRHFLEYQQTKVNLILTCGEVRCLLVCHFPMGLHVRSYRWTGIILSSLKLMYTQWCAVSQARLSMSNVLS